MTTSEQISLHDAFEEVSMSRGAAAHLLSQLLVEAKARGDKEMVLEVFEQNFPALSLYRGFRFAELSRLFGWQRAATAKLPECFGPK